MHALGLVILLAGLVNACIYLSSSQSGALMFVAVFAVLGTVSNGPFFSSMQSLVPGNMRSVSLAITFLFANLIGLGLGPLMIGYLSDSLQGAFGNESLRYALVAVSPIVVGCAFYYWKTGNSIAEDIRRAELEETKINKSNASATPSSIDFVPAENNR